jgi:hypothetical protein
LLEKYTGYELALVFNESGYAEKLAVQVEVLAIVNVWQKESHNKVSPTESTSNTKRQALYVPEFV